MEDCFCHSLNHRAVLQLFRAAHGLSISDAGIADIRKARGEDLVAISAAHGIAPIMADALERFSENELGLERDLRIFWRELRQGNWQRNQKMKAQLSDAAAILAEENIPIVVLKGGCDLMLASAEAFHRRFVGDLDLLVVKSDLSHARKALMANGYRNAFADDEFYHIPDHHDAPLVCKDWPAAIEVHQAIGGEGGERFLATDTIMENAKATPVNNLQVPSPLNRLLHSVFHRQIQDGGFQDRVISLRNVADVGVLAANPQLAQEARVVFNTAGLIKQFNGLLAATELLLPGLLPSLDHGRDAQVWARTAIRRVGTPRRVTFDSQARNVVRWVRSFATDPELRSIYVAKLLKRGSINRMVHTLRKLNRH